MAKQPASAIRVYLDEFDFSGVLHSTDMTVDQETPVVTAFSDAGPRRVVSNYDVSNADLGYMEPANDGYDEQIHTLLDNDDHFHSKFFTGISENSVSYDAIVHLSASPRSAQLGGAVLLNFDTQGSNGVVRGLVLGSATVTGAGQRTGRNQGATTAGTIYAVIFRLVAFTGVNITLTVQESQNDGNPDAYANIAGLTSGTLSAIGAVRATTTAATEAWKRVDISSAGGFTSATILVTAGIVQGT